MNQELIIDQFNELRLSYPELNIQYEDSVWSVQGLLVFGAEYAGQRIDDEYSVRILLPNGYPNGIPQAFETAGRIPNDFHKFHDGSFCLGEPFAVMRKFLENPTLLGYVKNCLIPYLYSYSYKCKYGDLPFGELPHGQVGLIRHYLELFHLKNEHSLGGLIAILAKENYRGHVLCPCGSGKRLRSCHGRQLLEILNLKSPGYFQSLYRALLQHITQEPPPIQRTARSASGLASTERSKLAWR